MRQAAFLACALVAALVSTSLAGAEAPLPAKDALLGGGAIGTHFVSGHFDVKYTTIRVDKTTGKSLHLYAEWPVRCASRGPVTAVFDTEVPLRPDGSFGKRGSIPSSSLIPHGLQYTLAGAFDTPTSAHVDGSARFTYAGDGKPASCSATHVKTEVRAPGAVAGSPAPQRGGAYFGVTSDTGSVLLRVAAGGQQVAEIAEEGWLDCKTPELKKNGGPFFRNTSPPETIAADGSFHGSESFDDTQELLPGTVAHMRSWITGKFGATGAHGTWELLATVVDKKTKKVEDTCHRKVTWTVSV